MPTEVVMPRLSDTMESGTIARWLKNEGDSVKRGDIIAEIETDKSNMELEAYATGIFARIIVREGESAALGQPIALIAASADEARQLKGSVVPAAPTGDQARTTAPEPKTASSSPPTEAVPGAEASGPNGATREPIDQNVLDAAAAAAGETARSNERIKSSPLARRLAREHGVDLASISGAGPGGRITKEDVESFLAGATPASPAGVQTVGAAPLAPALGGGGGPPIASGQTPPAIAGEGPRSAQAVEMTRMGRTIARRMTQSKFSAPEFILTAEFDMTDARALLKSLAGVEGAPRIGPNDLLIKAVATALTQHPEINSGWENEGIVRFGRVNVGNAVALPGGLVVPVIQDADRKSLGQIAADSKSSIDKARAGKLQPGEYDGGTFTVSNLGMYGIDQFTAILNPPESCILAVGAITPKPVVVDGAVVVRDRMRVSMSCDHRVINGAQGAEFLRTLRGLLEHPLLALL